MRVHVRSSATAFLLLASIFFAGPSCTKNKYKDMGLSQGITYTSAFQSAISWKIVREIKNQDYMEFLGESRYFISPKYRLCSAQQLTGEWIRNPEICEPTIAAQLPDCENNSGCGAIKLDRSVIEDQRLSKWIVQALDDPCRTLVDPNSYKKVEPRNAQGGQLLPLSSTWWVLSCGRVGSVRAQNIKFDKTRNIVRFQFQP